MFFRENKKNIGFTLIEMLVALSLFTIVVTIAVGAFLSLIGASRGVQSEQSVMTTLTFVLDSMTREIRTGTSYNCNDTTFSNQEGYGSTAQNCENGSDGVSFVESGSSITGASSRIAYYYDDSTGTLFRRVGNGTAQSIVSDGITVTDAQFFVTGSRRLAAGFTGQPTVTIILEARDETGATTTLQTTVTQRELDI
jgi:prepilin-type N-terminal cleavage/methylation domain-containing protein